MASPEVQPPDLHTGALDERPPFPLHGKIALAFVILLILGGGGLLLAKYALQPPEPPAGWPWPAGQGPTAQELYMKWYERVGQAQSLELEFRSSLYIKGTRMRSSQVEFQVVFPSRGRRVSDEHGHKLVWLARDKELVYESSGQARRYVLPHQIELRNLQATVGPDRWPGLPLEDYTYEETLLGGLDPEEVTRIRPGADPSYLPASLPAAPPGSAALTLERRDAPDVVVWLSEEGDEIYRMAAEFQDQGAFIPPGVGPGSTSSQILVMEVDRYELDAKIPEGEFDYQPPAGVTLSTTMIR